MEIFKLPYACSGFRTDRGERLCCTVCVPKWLVPNVPEQHQPIGWLHAGDLLDGISDLRLRSAVIVLVDDSGTGRISSAGRLPDWHDGNGEFVRLAQEKKKHMWCMVLWYMWSLALSRATARRNGSTWTTNRASWTWIRPRTTVANNPTWRSSRRAIDWRWATFPAPAAARSIASWRRSAIVAGVLRFVFNMKCAYALTEKTQNAHKS